MVKKKHTGVKVVVITLLVIILLFVALVAFMIHVGEKMKKDGLILDGTWTSDNCQLTLNFDDDTYEITIDGNVEKGKFSNVVYKNDAPDIKDEAYEVTFEATEKYTVTMDCNIDSDPSVLKIASDKFSQTYELSEVSDSSAS